MSGDVSADGACSTRPAPNPLIEAAQSTGSLVVLWIFLLVPFAALIAAIPLAWGWGLSALDAVMAVIGYALAMAGATVGFHRHLTHGSFKARRGLHVALAVAGSLAVEGTPTKWVADHRRHHASTYREGDPHSPWRYGTGVAANFWPLAILSFGESWHNSHHADPTRACHGVLRGQIDPAARLIWLFERLGWASDVRWPDPQRLAARRAGHRTLHHR
ncbi:acyl-CoA desaturase [Paractinoplanes rishiriensis]|uniref:Acyl-CoA desaturase n=1 Tax=Paractinoplanes rishiriensis TaxID=1050105 RepID=A0A919K875_9ACTN|nr:acyl-CoA desaturase [Actinoplanes rishiriensis]GIF01849.1 hypothetical protein Ari01nite_93130 [Actinoplanes rishiriensis]